MSPGESFQESRPVSCKTTPHEGRTFCGATQEINVGEHTLASHAVSERVGGVAELLVVVAVEALSLEGGGSARTRILDSQLEVARVSLGDFMSFRGQRETEKARIESRDRREHFLAQGVSILDSTLDSRYWGLPGHGEVVTTENGKSRPGLRERDLAWKAV